MQAFSDKGLGCYVDAWVKAPNEKDPKAEAEGEAESESEPEAEGEPNSEDDDDDDDGDEKASRKGEGRLKKMRVAKFAVDVGKFDYDFKYSFAGGMSGVKIALTDRFTVQ